MIEAAIRYLKDCYKNDNSRTVLRDVTHKAIEELHFIDGLDEVSTGVLSGVPFPIGKGDKLARQAKAYRKEKELVFGTLMLLGKVLQNNNEPLTVCAPLLLHPTTMKLVESVWFAVPDLSRRRINQGLLELLPLEELEESVVDRLWDLVNQPRIDASMVLTISRLLEEYLPGLDGDEALIWPELASKKKIISTRRKIEQGEIGKFKLLSGAIVALMPHPRGSRGILDDLTRMADSGEYSDPLLELLDAFSEGKQRDEFSRRVPALLSGAQMKVLQNAKSYPTSLVIGPPGTGKSFTIAALALDHAARGEKVLVVSRQAQAVDVIEEKIRKMSRLSHLAMRGGGRDYLGELKKFFETLLSGAIQGGKPGDREWLTEIEQDLSELDSAIIESEEKIAEQVETEIQLGRKLAAEPEGLVDRIKFFFTERKASRSVDLWRLVDQLEAQLEQHRVYCLDRLRLRRRAAIDMALSSNNRRQYVAFLKGLRARNSGKQDKAFSKIDFHLLLEAFPIWLITLSDLHKIMPLEKELFDIVVIDEASQCDMASCLPALQRARRLAVVGDQHQLRHISFLARSQMAFLQDKHGLVRRHRELLNYREMSILDLVNERLEHQDRVSFLDEHFRGEPELIAFSNEKFYHGALKVMTHRPDMERKKPLKGYHVLGQREANGVNPIEAEALLRAVLAEIEAARGLEKDLLPDIGILSPFRAQADWLTQELTELISYDDWQRHRILVGTAHTFQGEERNSMYLSLAVAPGYHHASLRFLQSPSVFNVSITRARTAMHVYHSIQASDLPMGSLLREYLAFIEQPSKESPEMLPTGDLFMRDVTTALVAQGCAVIPEFPLGGVVMDLIVRRNEQFLAVDLVGYPGLYAGFAALDHYKILARTGMPIFALPYSKWHLDQEACIAEILKALEPKQRRRIY